MLLKVTLDRKTGQVISEELIESPEVPDMDFFIEVMAKAFIKKMKKEEAVKWRL